MRGQLVISHWPTTIEPKMGKIFSTISTLAAPLALLALALLVGAGCGQQTAKRTSGRNSAKT
jgi:hypothetical protein